MPLSTTDIFHNSLLTWLGALATVFFIYLLASLIKSFGLRRLSADKNRMGLHWDDAIGVLISSTHSFFFLAVAVFTAVQALYLPPRIAQFVDKAVFVAFLMQLCFSGTALIRYWVEQDVKEKAALDGARAQSMRAIGFLSTLLLYTVVILWGLDNFGVNITTLVAGLGVGGIAVALAVQNILGDLFASLTIVLDKPFVYGDFIHVGEYKGTIEHVGLKTTRIRSLSGEQLVFPNSDLLQSRIRNYKRMQERRVCFSLGAPYDTPPEKLEQIPSLLKGIIESQPKVRFDRCHLLEFADSALKFETVYWILASEYKVYADIHQTVNLAILRAFNERGIEFAFPSQTVYVKRS